MTDNTDAVADRAEDENAEFDAAFEEFSAPPGRDAPKPEPVDDPPEDEAEEADEPAGEEPEPETRSREQQLEAELAQLRHALTSDRGRISALTKKLDSLQNSAAPAPPSQKQVSQAMKSPAAWDSFKEDYPDIAEALEARFSAFDERLTSTLEPVARTQAELSAAKAQADERQEIAALTSPREQGGYGHADFQQVVQSDAYQQWVVRQPHAVQSLANSPHAADAAFLLDAFKASPAYQPPADTGLAERRQRKLASAASVGGRKSGPSEIAEDDFEAAFDAFAARRDRARAR